MQCRNVLTRIDALRTRELAPIEKAAVEAHLRTCRSCDESQDDVERGRERSLHQHARHVRWNRLALDGGGVDTAEDDWNAGKERVLVPKQEVQRRLHHGDDEIQRLVRVLAAKEFGNERLIAGCVELRKRQGLAVNLGAGPQL